MNIWHRQCAITVFKFKWVHLFVVCYLKCLTFAEYLPVSNLTIETACCFLGLPAQMDKGLLTRQCDIAQYVEEFVKIAQYKFYWKRLKTTSNRLKCFLVWKTFQIHFLNGNFQMNFYELHKASPQSNLMKLRSETYQTENINFILWILNFLEGNVANISICQYWISLRFDVQGLLNRRYDLRFHSR